MIKSHYNIDFIIYFLIVSLPREFFVSGKVCEEYYITALLYVERTQDTMPKLFEKLYKYFPTNRM